MVVKQAILKLKQTTVAGRVPNTEQITAGEPAINLADKKLYSSDGTSVFQVAPSMAQHNAKAPIDNPNFTGNVGLPVAGITYLPSTSGGNSIRPGTGDGASFGTYNFAIHGWFGMGMVSYDGTTNGVYDFRTGTWNVKGGYSVDGPWPYARLNKTDGTSAQLLTQQGGINRWQLELGSADIESGENAGSNFILSRFADNGDWLGYVFGISRKYGVFEVYNGMAVWGGSLTVNGAAVALASDIPFAVQSVRPEVQGAIGNASADDATALSTTAALGLPIVLGQGKEYKTTNVLWNTSGVPVSGPGKITTPVQVQTSPALIKNRQISTTVHDGKIIDGENYMFVHHNRLIARQSSNIVLSGDSTTFGAVVDSAFVPLNYLKECGDARGFSRFAIFNRGFGSKTTQDWLTSYIAADIALDPDVVVLGWGINDPLNGISVAQTKANLRNGLDQYRSSANGGHDACSIIVRAPNAVSFVKDGADERWLEEVRPIYRQAALDYKCAFIDTPALAYDAYYGAGRYMDDLGWFAGVHPKNTMNALLWVAVADLIWPRGLHMYSDVAKRSISGLRGDYKARADLPSTYPFGESTMVGNTSSGWFASVVIHTDKQADGACTQWVSTFEASPHLWVRVSDVTSNTWSLLTPITSQETNAVAGGGFTLDQLRVTRTGMVVQCGGWLLMNSPAALASGAHLMTLPPGYRPAKATIVPLCVSNGTGQTEVIPVTVNTDGVVVTAKATAIAAAVVDCTISFPANLV